MTFEDIIFIRNISLFLHYIQISIDNRFDKKMRLRIMA